MRICQTRCSVLLCEIVAKVPNRCLLRIDELLKALTATPLKVHWLRWRVKRLICGQDGCCNQQGLYVRADLMSPFTLWAKKTTTSSQHPFTAQLWVVFFFSIRHICFPPLKRSVLFFFVFFSLPLPHFCLFCFSSVDT